MELSLLLGQQIFTMILMLLTGWAAVRLGALTYEASTHLASLILYILAPCMIFASCQMPFSREKLFGLLIGIAGAIIVHLLFIGIAHILPKSLSLTSIDKASLIYTNAGNLLIPLIASVLGEEYVFYTSAFVAVQTVIIWTHGISLINGSHSWNIRKIITNPNIIALAAGLIFFLLPVSLPPLLNTTIQKLGNTIGPISMISIGVVMSSIPFKKILTDRHSFVVCILRLLILPLIFIVLIRISRITFFIPQAKMVLLETVLASAAPTAVSVTQFARLFGGDAGSASITNAMSTLLCIITMPVIIMIYQLLCF